MSTAKAPAAPSGRICEKLFTPLFLVMMNTGLQTEGTFQRLLINIVEIKYFERFTQIVGLFGSL